jgi:Ca-activated chloride channel family protein
MKRNVIILFLFSFPVPFNAAADGMIVIENPPVTAPGHFSFAPLAVSYHRVNVAIDGRVAVTSVDEEFYNPSASRMEGTYMFPLPADALIDRFSMDINGKETAAELLPADKARAIYEEIVRRLRDPALLEYAGRGAFKARIFPIEPRSRKRVRISYTQLLPADSGLVEYVYPLNTEKFSSAPVGDVSVKVTLNGKDPLKSVYCPTHDAEISRSGEYRAVVGWEAKNVRPDTDFKVVFSRTANRMGIDLIASRRGGEDGYFMLLLSPGAVTAGAPQVSKDVIFALDTSGSMAGEKLAQAKAALKQCLADLTPGDRFNIVRFSTESDALFDTLKDASAANLAAATRFVEGLRAAGGTAIDEALQTALSSRPRDWAASRPSYLIFLTDGLPTVGETREDPIVARVGKSAAGTRIFSFGVGTDVNVHLLDRVSGDSGGVSQYVLPGEDIEVKVSSFSSKIREPVLSGITVGYEGPIRVSQVLPSRLPDLFNGDMIAIFGRYSGSGSDTVRISGTVNGEKREFSAPVRFPAREDSSDYVPRLWAARRVGWLLDEIRMHGESAELRDEVVRLAREFGIVTPYTAYLILEDEQRRGVPDNIRSFQELERDREVLGMTGAQMDSMYEEAASESKRSGDAAVINSMAVQQMKDALNEAQASIGRGLAKAPSAPPSGAGSAGGGAVGYRAAQSSNYATQVKVVNGRSFYQNGALWTDSTAQAKPGIKQKTIQFNSKEYFDLLSKNPGAAQWFALGNNIDIVLGDTLYNIREN